ncbi:hypothetical protein SAE02_03340 [Skermanella aerolata]|uniref:Uncharacterized protein n=1 Tax=Skermanella aerolata TaxID=393310 RepID=A0A512DI97_9PROT|nr:hypothetical protein SAE02_03340 [Skermanella aerolata]
MDGLQPVDPVAKVLRQAIVGAEHRGEQGIAFLFRQLLGMQQRSQAGLAKIRQVGMPVAAGIGKADWLAFLKHKYTTKLIVIM